MNGISVYDSYAQEEFTVKADLFGFLGDLLALYELAGNSLSFSNTQHWCMRCQGGRHERIAVGPARNSEELRSFFALIEQVDQSSNIH